MRKVRGRVNLIHKPIMVLLVVATALLALLVVGCSDETTPTPISTPTDAPALTSTATLTTRPTCPAR